MSAAAPRDPSRRALLRGRRTVPVRPPGAPDEDAFAARCTRCRACLDACPERIVVVGEGGYPELDFGRGECTFCGACTAACAPHALDLAKAAAWPWRAAIDTRCLTHAGVVCRSCADVCPEAAITFAPSAGASAPRLMLDACSGCGACVGACPAQAIAMRRGHAREAAAA